MACLRATILFLKWSGMGRSTLKQKREEEVFMESRDTEHIPSGEMEIQPSGKPERSKNGKPWWRGKSVGYTCAVLLVAVGAGLTLVGEMFLPRFYFPSVFLLVAILLASLFWGVGPGLLALLLSCVSLAYYNLSPFGSGNLAPLDWELLFQILPFALAGLVIAMIASQRETARQRALWMMQLARDQAARLSDMNEELQQANQLKDFF